MRQRQLPRTAPFRAVVAMQAVTLRSQPLMSHFICVMRLRRTTTTVMRSKSLPLPKQRDRVIRRIHRFVPLPTTKAVHHDRDAALRHSEDARTRARQHQSLPLHSSAAFASRLAVPITQISCPNTCHVNRLTPYLQEQMILHPS